MKKTIILGFVLGFLLLGSAGSSPARAQSRPAEQPPAELIVEPPVPELLAK